MARVTGRLTSIVALVVCLAAACGGSVVGKRPDAGAIGGAGGGMAASGWALQPLPVPAGRSSSWSWFDMGGAVADRYIVGSERVILQSTDEGMTWSNIGDRTGLPDPYPAFYPYFSSVSVGAISNVWVLAVMEPNAPFANRLFHSIDRGQSWETIQAGSAQPMAVWASRERVVVLGAEGDIWHSTDTGATWARVFVDSGMRMIGVWGTGGDDVYAVGTWAPGPVYPDAGVADGGASVDASPTFPSSGFVVHSADGGATWRIVLTDTACSLLSVRGTPDGQAVYATGSCGSMAWTTDHGASWSLTGSTALRPTKYIIGAPWVSAAGTTYFPLEVFDPVEVGASVCTWFAASDSGFAPEGCATVPGRREENAPTIWARPAGVWGIGDNEVWAYSQQGLFWRKR